MNNEKGFTLIELIVIIVILGILAVTAVPKYVDMQADAKDAAAEGVYGAAQSAAAINFAASLLPGSSASVTDITDASSLIDTLDGGLPEGWALLDGDCSAFPEASTFASSVGCICLDSDPDDACTAADSFFINITTIESDKAKAVVDKDW